MSAGTIVIKKNVLTLKKSQSRNEDKQQILVIGINVYTVGLGNTGDSGSPSERLFQRNVA